MLEHVEFDEAKQSQLPLVELLINMGYTYLSREEALVQRGGDTSKYLLQSIARQSLMEINAYENAGQIMKFSEADVAGVVEELESIRLEGIIDTSRNISHMIMPKIGGKTIEVFADGRRESKSFRYIDFSDGGKSNQYHVTVEYKVTGRETIRCDIVCFVNGMPIAVIENKKSSVDISKGIAQLNRYQKQEYAPKLFTYAQLLIAANGANWLYGTTGTPERFYANWREKGAGEAQTHESIKQLIAKPMDDVIYKQILTDLNGYTQHHAQSLSRHIKPQDEGAYAMLRPERLLDIIKNFVFYDGPHKKVARYQQYFAVRSMIDRVHQQDGERRRGGIVWHTQGSGKSLTMVMFIRALVEDPDILNPRVIVVTDRKDLDRQIRDTLRNGGLKKEVIQAQSGQHLLDLIEQKESAVVTTLVQKFGSAARATRRFTDADPNIFVIVDEAHRSHSRGEKSITINASEEMRKTIPNASFLAFTGTPLLRDEKSKRTWGDFIDKYTIDDALKDKIVLPLIYEGRYIPLYDDAVQIDRRYDRVSEDLSAKQKYILQRQVEKKVIAENPDRVREICYDVQKHYISRFQGTGLKAQLVAPSKHAALIMQKFFEKEGLIQSALIVSDENGEIPGDDENKHELAAFLRQVKEKHQSLQKYEESVIESFKESPDGIELIIVVDKLLTGFDAPRNTVLYLAKELKDHNLLQAIARVNRLFDNDESASEVKKTSGYIIDYSENAANIQTAMQLFGNYESADVEHTLIDVTDKIGELEHKYTELCAVFDGVAPDDQLLIEHLRPETTRKLFGEKLSEFITVFAECLSIPSFDQAFDVARTDLLKRDALKFQELKKSAALQYGDHVDLRKYQLELVKILDENIKAGEAEIMTAEVDITDREQLDKAIEELGSDASKAEAIAAQTERRISERREQDEVLYDRFSKRIQEILHAMREKKLADVEAFKQLRLLADEVEHKRDTDLPPTVQAVYGADVLYRNLKISLPLKDDDYTQAILGLTAVVQQSATVDWWRSFEAKRQMRSRLDDYIYEELHISDYKVIDTVIDNAVNLAEHNHQLYGA